MKKPLIFEPRIFGYRFEVRVSSLLIIHSVTTFKMSECPHSTVQSFLSNQLPPHVLCVFITMLYYITIQYQALIIMTVTTDIIMASKFPFRIVHRLIYIARQNSAGWSSGKCFQLFLVECIVVPTRIASDVTCLSLLIFCRHN